MSFGIPGDFKPGERRGVSVLSFDKWNHRMIGFPPIEGNHSFGNFAKIGILDTGYAPGEGLPVPRAVKGFGYKAAEDENGHGTHVYGIVSRIARNAQYFIARVLGKSGMGQYVDIYNGGMWLIDECKVHMINMSVGGKNKDPYIQRLVDYAKKKGVLLICSSGNSGKNEPFYPAAYDYPIAVGAINRAYKLANFSTTGFQLDLVGPGVDIWSNWIGGDMAPSSGTSQAAPHITGLSALIIDHYMLDHNRQPSVEEIKETLYSNADDLGVLGWDKRYGMGLGKAQFHKKRIDLKAKPPVYMKLVLKVVSFLVQYWLKKKSGPN